MYYSLNRLLVQATWENMENIKVEGHINNYTNLAFQDAFKGNRPVSIFVQVAYKETMI